MNNHAMAARHASDAQLAHRFRSRALSFSRPRQVDMDLLLGAGAQRYIAGRQRRGELAIEGNLQPLMAHLQFVKDLLATGREAQA